MLQAIRDARKSVQDEDNFVKYEEMNKEFKVNYEVLLWLLEKRCNKNQKYDCDIRDLYIKGTYTR